MEERVIEEVSLKDVIYCEVDNPLLLPQPEHSLPLDPLEARISRRLKKLNTFENLTKYIEQTIRQLERRQIAESVTKVLKVERPRGLASGEVRVTIGFENGMGLKPITFS